MPFISSAPPIRAAIRRVKSAAVRLQLEECDLVAGVWCHGLTARQLQCLRGSLPPSAKLLVAKNSLLANALVGTQWAPLVPRARGTNAWIFARTDDIRTVLGPYRDFKRDGRFGPNDFIGAVFEGRLYRPDDFKELETMPTRPEICSYLLGCLQVPACSVIGTLEAGVERLEEGGGGAQVQQ